MISPQLLHIQNTEGKSIDVVVRMLTHNDRDALVAFYHLVPRAELFFFDDDIEHPEVIENRFISSELEKKIVLIAVRNNDIIGEALLVWHPRSRSPHVAEIQSFILPDYRNLGLGHAMLKRLNQLALQNGIEKLMGRVPQRALPLFEKPLCSLGFYKEAVLKDHLKDASDQKDDLVIFSHNLEDLWERISDWQSRYGRAMEY